MTRRKNQRLSMAGYADVLRAVVDGPVTQREVVERAGIAKTNAWRILGTLHHMRVIHISAWVARPRSPYMPAYGIGDKPDAPMPTTRPNGKACEVMAAPKSAPSRLSAEVIGFAALVRALEQPASVAELEAATGIFERTIRNAIGRMRELGLVFIADWERRAYGGGLPIANYQWGIGQRDKPRLQPLGRQRAQRRYRESRASREAQQFINRALASSANHQEEATA